LTLKPPKDGLLIAVAVVDAVDVVDLVVDVVDLVVDVVDLAVDVVDLVVVVEDVMQQYQVCWKTLMNLDLDTN
jgi:hypothetical protein